MLLISGSELELYFAASKLIPWDFKDKHKHFLLRESLLFLFNQIKSTFELVQEGFRHPIISRYLTHSYVTEILILDQVNGTNTLSQPGSQEEEISK